MNDDFISSCQSMKAEVVVLLYTRDELRSFKTIDDFRTLNDVREDIRQLKHLLRFTICPSKATGEMNKYFNNYIFRGVSNSSYELIPSAFRHDVMELFWLNSYAEFEGDKSLDVCYSEFIDRVDDAGLYVPGLDYSFKYAVKSKRGLLNYKKDGIFYHTTALAQHYGVPTSFLDWTFDFDTALCFAVYKALKKMYWYFQGKGLSVEKGVEYLVNNKIAIWSLEINKNNYSGNRIPFNIIEPPRYGNQNMAAQQGVFSYWEKMFPGKRKCIPMESDELLEGIELSWAPMLVKVEIEYLNVPRIWKLYLQEKHFDVSRLFPGYEGIKESIYEKAYYNKLTQLINSYLRLSKSDVLDDKKYLSRWLTSDFFKF